MRTSTQTIEIAARPEDVFDFVADPATLPRWAIGFAKAIRQDDEAWVVTTASGDELPLSVEADAATRVVDFHVGPAGATVPAASPVVANGAGSQFVFTMFQPHGFSDELFEAQIAELGRELIVLKANLESSCPL